MSSRPAFLLACFLAIATASAEEARPLGRIAFGSCNREYKPQLIWKPIVESKPDLWIWLGDIVYGRADDLPDLARRYRIAKEQPDYKALREQCKVVGVWDDNDFGVSNGGNDNPKKIESQRLLLDFLDEPPGNARRAQAGVYATYDFGPIGKQVQVILLDGRFHRDRPGPEGDILGAEQWAWLEQKLTGSAADVHIIGSGIQVIASEHRYEKWANFPKARQRLFDLLARTKARTVIFLSGDRHLGEISRISDPRMASPIYDITSSGMTHHATDGFFHSFSKEPNQFRVGHNYIDLNFGLLQFDWNASPATATAQIRGVDNAVHIEEKIILTPAESP